MAVVIPNTVYDIERLSADFAPRPKMNDFLSEQHDDELCRDFGQNLADPAIFVLYTNAECYLDELDFMKW